MLTPKFRIRRENSKFLKAASVLILCVSGLSACSTNPATGKNQFAGLMSPQQENQVGAQEHETIVKQYGLYEDAKLQSYVDNIGSKITQKTERPDVQYKFFIIDSPIVNAFALPGGYVYVSRGLLALANSEAELAGVMAHETGHITARHSAERYSHGVATSLGATILSAVLDSSAASEAIGLGANMYMSGYSRGQENEADTLGIRYMTQGGYDPNALSSFLNSLNSETQLLAQIEGKKVQESYLSTHPPTPERVQKTASEAKAYSLSMPIANRDAYLNMINGLVYGDSADQGFIRGNSFYHPEIGFAFDAPKGYTIINQPTQVIAKAPQSGAIMVFDMVSDNANANNPAAFMQNSWMRGKQTGQIESITINGMNAAATSITGTVNNQSVSIQLIAIQWQPGRFARYQIAIPQGVSASELNAIKTASYSFRKLSAADKQNLKPQRIQIITARSGDTVQSLAARMPFDTYREERFRLLNGLTGGQNLTPGQKYKTIVE
jgi:predicted Zn-dependent protease